MISGHNGEPVAAISIAMPTNRFQEHGGDSIGMKARETALQISVRLGYTPRV